MTLAVSIPRCIWRKDWDTFEVDTPLESTKQELNVGTKRTIIGDGLQELRARECNHSLFALEPFMCMLLRLQINRRIVKTGALEHGVAALLINIELLKYLNIYIGSALTVFQGHAE